MKNKKEFFSIKAIIAIVIICILLVSTVSIAKPVESEKNFGFSNINNKNNISHPSDINTIKNIARWDGDKWYTMSKGRNASSLALTTYGEDLIVGGIFDDETQGSCPPMYINDSIIRWDGFSWSLLTNMGSPLIAFIYSETIWNDHLYSGGFFFGESGIHHLAKYEGSSGWSEVGGGTYHPDYMSDVLTLNVFDDRLVVGGRFKWVEQYDGILARGLALWDGSSWDPIGNPTYDDKAAPNWYTSSCVIGDDLYVAGRFNLGIAPYDYLKNLAVYGNYGSGGSLGWSDEHLITDIDLGDAGMILTVEEYNGDIVIGGFFTEIDGVPVNHIARWDGNQWHAFDGGMTGDDPEQTRVHDIIVYNGELIAGGCFNSAGSSSAKNLAKWDGSSWSEIGSDIVEEPFVEALWHGVWAMHEYNGDLIVAGNFIYDMLPPETPTIDGPTEGTAGEEYTYTFCSTDPNGDDITYCINFGDDTELVYIGPLPSGTCGSVSHIWEEEGTYTIGVKARDRYGEESDWAVLEVVMPVNQHLQYNYLAVIQKILDRFPNAFPILRHIFGLN